MNQPDDESPKQARSNSSGSAEEPRYTVRSAASAGAAVEESTRDLTAPAEDARPAAPPPSSAPVGASTRKVAVFVAHGMGQQIPFQTLDQVAEGLRKEAEAKRQRPLKTEVRSVKHGEQWLNRIELTLETPGRRTEAHIYEGYWAPLTEGKINTAGVIRFLTGAGLNGIKNGSGGFQRWLFNCYWKFDSPVRIVLYLLIALLAVASLVVMNSTILAIAAARALLAQTPLWLTNGLFADLTTTFNGVLVALLGFVAALAIAMVLRRFNVSHAVRTAWGMVSILALGTTLFAITLGGVALGLLFYSHVRLSPGPDAQLWTRIFAAENVARFNTIFDATAIWALGVIGGGIVLYKAIRVATAVAGDVARRRGRSLTLLSAAFMALLIGSAGYLALRFLTPGQAASAAARGAESVALGLFAWPALVVASAAIRKLLIQFVGDVAIYVTPYTLDAYYQLRDDIKKGVQRTATAVYSLPSADGSGYEYEEVLVVGHSLGSVIVYDVLNRLINDDLADGKLNVIGRTPLLLTFGSPLDKTAFIFAVQRNHTTEAREALAASVQPLIRDYALRPRRWINIYSPWDIISGNLGFYDPPDPTDPRQVKNIADPDASTLLAAHVEYWENPLLFQTLYAELGGEGGVRV
ncbi:MAG: hypothetical protein KY464_08905 [Gemmatimonadetes bacterium]|nr:hypothetical protein [Gemmatimonadota bacterium]